MSKSKENGYEVCGMCGTVLGYRSNDKAKPNCEMIIWHKYPDEKPVKSKSYLITYRTGEYFVVIQSYYEIRLSCFYDMNTPGYPRDEQIIAWADMPKGWHQ